jgi:ADP-ribose pyrophosphatase
MELQSKRKPWRTLARRVALNHSKYLVVEEHTVELPDGRVIPDWPWVVTPDYINVVVITDAGQFLCFRQTKYGIEGLSLAPECHRGLAPECHRGLAPERHRGLAPVGGYLEPGEDPLAAAQRELLEETGCQASDWTALGSYIVDGNRGVGTAHFFLARGARRVTEPVADDLEEQEIVYLSRAEFEAALAAGEFRSLPWVSIAALALLRLQWEETAPHG